MVYYEMFGFVSQIFVSAIMLFGCNILNANILNANAKVFNIISRTNETRYIGWHGTCRCKCRLNASFVIKSKDVIKVNAGVNARNKLTKE